jgi:hypothetical protein
VQSVRLDTDTPSGPEDGGRVLARLSLTLASAAHSQDQIMDPAGTDAFDRGLHHRRMAAA